MNALLTPHPVALASLPRRARGVVVGHGTSPALSERLAAVGLGVGAQVEVVQSGVRTLVQVHETRIALGPELSGAVQVLCR